LFQEILLYLLERKGGRSFVTAEAIAEATAVETTGVTAGVTIISGSLEIEKQGKPKHHL